MSLSAQEADDDNSGVLVARMDSARNMSNILKAIHFKDVSIKCMQYRPQPFTTGLAVTALAIRKARL